MSAAYDAPFPDDTHQAGLRQLTGLLPLTRNDPGAAIGRATMAALGRFERPFLTAYSDGDPATAGWDAVFQDHVPGAAGQAHTRIAGAGHFLQEQRGDELGRVVADFIAANPRSRSGGAVTPDRSDIRPERGSRVPACTRRGGMVMATLVMAGSLALAIGTGARPARATTTSSSAPGAATTTPAPPATVWLCRPGMADDPCTPSLTMTDTTPSGRTLGVVKVQRASQPKIDCFYVYPTVSDQKTPNADLTVDPTERSIALYQAAQYSRDCRVFAPMYRQLTISAITGPTTAAESTLAYDGVLQAWNTYLHKYNDGRGVVLIGHSQGSFVSAPTHDVARSIPSRRCGACWSPRC